MAGIPRSQMSGVFAAMLLAALSESGGVLLLLPLLDMLTTTHATTTTARGPFGALLSWTGLTTSPALVLAGFLCLTAIRSLAQVARERTSAQWQQDIVDNLRRRCFAALLRARWRWIASGRRHDHASLLLTDITRIGTGLQNGLGLIATLVTLAAYLTVSVTLSWHVTMLAMATGLLVMMAVSGQRAAAVQLGSRLGEAHRTMHAAVHESMAGLKLTKVLGSEARALNRFTTALGSLRKQQLAFIKVSSHTRAWFQFAGAALLVLYVYAGLTWAAMPVSALITLVVVFARVLPLLGAAQQQAQMALHAWPVLLDAQQLLQQAGQAAEPAPPPGPLCWRWQETISLEQVTLRHTERERPAIDQVSLVLRANTTTAVIGPSGAGKSTLADVLAGLQAPDSGRLLVDGAPVEGPALHRWRREVAYVPQDAVMFHDSVRSNLLWSRPDADEAALWTALHAAAAGFVARLPAGLDTIIGDAGMRLSGGERQRLALARALLQQPSLLILDEATSALDTENEARIREAIERLHGHLTVVLIGHRLPTLEHADQVVRIEDGRLVACGTWSELREPLPDRLQ